MDYTAAADLITDALSARIGTPLTTAEAAGLCDLESAIGAAFTTHPLAEQCTDYTLRLEVSDLAALGALAAAHPPQVRHVATPLACPTWCDRAGAHPFRWWAGLTDTLEREHTGRYGTREGTHLVSITSLEYASTAAGPILEHDGPHLAIALEQSDTLSLSAAQARALAAALLEAADALEQA